MFLTGEQILKAKKLPTEDVPVEEWAPEEWTPEQKKEAKVRVVTLSGLGRDMFDADTAARKKAGQNLLRNFRARVVAATASDEQGVLLFSLKQVEELGALSSKPLNRVFEVACRLNGFMESEIEDLEKKSETAQSEDSPSS